MSDPPRLYTFLNIRFQVGELGSDTLLIALEFEKSDKIYNFIAKIYESLENKELSKKILDPNLRLEAIKSLKEKLTGIYIKNN